MFVQRPVRPTVGGGTSSRLSRRGATAVEFAVVAPVFFLFLWSTFEFGKLHLIRHTADNAAYEACRHVIVPGGTVQEARAKADQLLAVVGAKEAEVTISPEPFTDQTSEITVTIRIPFAKNALFLPRFTGNVMLTSSATLKAERYNPIP